MALKNTQSYKKRNLRESITMVEYNKKLNKIIKKYNSFQIDECLVAMLEEANKYHIVDVNKKVGRVRKGKYDTQRKKIMD